MDINSGADTVRRISVTHSSGPDGNVTNAISMRMWNSGRKCHCEREAVTTGTPMRQHARHQEEGSHGVTFLGEHPRSKWKVRPPPKQAFLRMQSSGMLTGVGRAEERLTTTVEDFWALSFAEQKNLWEEVRMRNRKWGKGRYLTLQKEMRIWVSWAVRKDGLGTQSV